MQISTNLAQAKESLAVRNEFLNLFRAILQRELCTADKADWDWEGILSLAKSQQIFPLIFEEASHYSEFKSRNDFHEYFMPALKQIAAQKARTQSLLHVYPAFIEAGIHPLVLKGIVCRQLYGEYADFRPSCDEDILVRKQDFFKAKQVLEDNGFSVDLSKEPELDLDKIQELTFFNSKTNLVIELHVNLMGTSSEWHCRLNRLFDSVWDTARKVQIDKTCIWTMSHTDFFLYLVLHALKHFVYAGFGFRQLADIMLYENKYNSEIDWEYIEQTLDKVQGTSFFTDIHLLGNQYLGFDLPLRGSLCCPDKMLEDMIHTGIFGVNSQSDITAAQMTRWFLPGTHNKKSNGFLALWHTVFPSRSFMEDRNHEAILGTWNLWKAWFLRWKKFFQDCQKTDKNLAIEGTKTSHDRVKLLKEYNIL